jgi:hypothetical protein
MDLAKTQLKMAILKGKIGKGHLDFERLQELRDKRSISQPEFIEVMLCALERQTNGSEELIGKLRELRDKRSISQPEFIKAMLYALERQTGNNEELIGKLQELRCAGRITDVEFSRAMLCTFEGLATGEDGSVFIRAVVDVFRNQATEERGLMDILCEKGVIVPRSETYNKVFAYCLTDPDLGGTSLVALELSEAQRNDIIAANNPNTNPDSEFCAAVMAANTVEDMARVYSTFFGGKMAQADNMAKTHPGGRTEKGYYASQEDVLCRLIFCDIARSPAYLQIGDKRVTITGNPRFVPEGRQPVIKSSDGGNFEKLFNNILTEIKDQAGLSDEQAMQVMKQFLLAYRGQNGAGEGPFMLDPALMMGVGCLLRFDGDKASMIFQEDKDGFVLTEKMEASPIIGVQNPAMGAAFISSEVRFKFPGDGEVRTHLSVRSTRKETEDGSIQWSCPFRENPPRKVIFYGGCKPPLPPEE